MESNLSSLSSIKDEQVVYIQPTYKESYRLAIYALLCGGTEAYEAYLRAEHIQHFLSEQEIRFILENADLPAVEEDPGAVRCADEGGPSTYFPTESDEEVPDLDLGWPELSPDTVDTSISLLFHPPRHNTPTVKEVVRKQIQEARQVIAIAMDVFTDVDIFKEILAAALRGVGVYILLDDSHISSFLSMSRSVGVNIHDIKNLRVRTVQGQHYQCQSGMKFHGGLEQRFIMVDCRTVLYGTYSYTWSFEKINLSMVLVVTGQLVCSYDEEFRRLYARSVVPSVLSGERSSVPHRRDTAALQSQLSLNHTYMRSRMMPGSRSAQKDRLNDSTMLSRGLSVQERLHQFHGPDVEGLVRGHSYAGELQKVNSMTRLRMGTKGLGVPVPRERTGSNMRGGRDQLQAHRSSQQKRRHQTLYGAYQHLIPFNSETSLNRWKIDTYLTEKYKYDPSYDAISPLVSPHGSHTGLNEQQAQMIHSRSREIKSRIEELRQKRLSLQENANLRQSQESLKSVYSTSERPKFVSPVRGVDRRPAVTNSQDSGNPDKREQIFNDGQRSLSHDNFKTVADQKPEPTYNWQDPPLSKTKSDADLDTTDTALKLSALHSNGLSTQHSRMMESLTEIPEEKEASTTPDKSLDLTLRGKKEEICKEMMPAPLENSVKSSFPAESQCQDQAQASHSSEMTNSICSAPPRERRKSSDCKDETNPSASEVSHLSAEAQIGHAEKGQTQQEEQEFQRKNSLRTKVHSVHAANEKKAPNKEEKTIQRRASLRSTAEQTSKKDQGPGMSRSQNSLSALPKTEKPKSKLSRLSPQRSSKRKTNLTPELDKSPWSTLDGEGAAGSQSKRERAYSRYEFLVPPVNDPNKPVRPTRVLGPDRDKSSSLNRRDTGTPVCQSQSGTDKLGRFMQRVGHLINKNK
ncbi:protein FAM83B-like [Cololabis saira]|uniref:protein FAM83B-like n=1 Tax=Cololabis saira TaxID=129043 RepID=UPI002AD3A7CE|nr:protein FAM83B-like [Cololabis saira]